MKDHFCVVSSEICDDIRQKLETIFGELILMPPDNELAKPVRCHPDMIFCVIDGVMFLSKRYYSENTDVAERIAKLGKLWICAADDVRGDVYPQDVGFNIAVGNGYIICKSESVSRSVLDYAEIMGYRIISVKQGYSGCSCIMTDSSVLTFDRGIAVQCGKYGIPVTRLEDGGVFLNGYNCGFLGGAGGYCNGVIYIYGNAQTLNCYSALSEYAAREGYKVISLSDGNVYDYGGIKIYKTKED